MKATRAQMKATLKIKRMKEKRFLSIGKIAKLLGVSRATLHRRVTLHSYNKLELEKVNQMFDSFKGRNKNLQENEDKLVEQGIDSYI